MPLPELITNRSASDLTALEALREKIINRTATQEEWTEWLGGVKAAYNASDLNRVGEAIDILSDLLSDAGYSVTVSPKTDWDNDDNFNATSAESYLSNISSIRAALAVFQTTPEVPSSMNNLDVSKANDIERILQDVDTLLENLKSISVKSGAVNAYCGTEMYIAEVNA